MVIAGPTAVGKTALAIALANYYNTVVLSADSRQFYREMTIGTAKPTAAELAEVPHHFINNKSVGQLYGAGHYEKDVMALLGTLFETHDVVILAGGSGLYIDAVINGVDDFEEVPAEIRESLNTQYAEKGIEWLRQALEAQDPVYYKTVDTGNPQRMIRALEVCLHTGKPFSSFLEKGKAQRPFTSVGILLNRDREQLYKAINARVDSMLQHGLLEEVRGLSAWREFNALKTVGYKELFEHLDGLCSLEQAVDKIKQHTRNYAKRQLTWFRNKAGFKELEAGAEEEIKAYLNTIVHHA